MPDLMRTVELSFELGHEIGQEGKNSEVFKARDLQLNSVIAVKKIPKTDFSDMNEYFIESSMLYLSNHSNVVQIQYGCQDSDYIYLAMPFYKNGSLKAKMLNGKLSVREIIVYSTQILSGLHNIHSKGLIHFDVKPDNVLLSDRNEALLSDFGLAKQTTYNGDAQQDRSYRKMVPPESFTTNAFNKQFDIYQFGLTLHRMCVGDESFYAEYELFCDAASGQLDIDRYKHAVLNGQFPSKNNYPEHIPQKIIDTIKKCLVRDLDQRYSAAIEVVNDLAKIDGNLLDWYFSEDADQKVWQKMKPNGQSYQMQICNAW